MGPLKGTSSRPPREAVFGDGEVSAAGCPIDIDGAVSFQGGTSLRCGARSAAPPSTPGGAIAYKFPPELQETTLKDNVVQVGRTGVLTPNGRLVGGPVRTRARVDGRAAPPSTPAIISGRMDIRIGEGSFSFSPEGGRHYPPRSWRWSGKTHREARADTFFRELPGLRGARSRARRGSRRPLQRRRLSPQLLRNMNTFLLREVLAARWITRGGAASS
jgi:hypothetical protein